MLDHGGGILAAAQRYGIARDQWVDLSTGLNPHGWPVPALSARAWQRLPEENDGLETAAGLYYGADCLLPVAGSQPAIQALPRMRARSTVGMLETSYAEHAHAWACNGHKVVRLAPGQIDAAIDQLDVLLVCHPNNPTGWHTTHAQLNDWRLRLNARGGWLVIDEAYMDSTPQDSMLAHAGQPGLVILRSIGKFFGLAGARVGFVFAWRALLERLRDELGPWTLAGPAREAARLALLDTDWQDATRRRLRRESDRLASLLTQYGLTPDGGTDLFQWLRHPQALALYEFLARHGILCRYFALSGSVRLGLPADETEWQKLERVLAAFGR